MFLNDFSVRIDKKKETYSGYVEMNNGETYTIILKNNTNRLCDAYLKIDGKNMGIFRIPKNSNIKLNRPIEENKQFTFYNINSKESEKSGLHKIDPEFLGLIEVTFKVEKEVPNSNDVPEKVYIPYTCPPAPDDEEYYEKQRYPVPKKYWSGYDDIFKKYYPYDFPVFFGTKIGGSYSISDTSNTYDNSSMYSSGTTSTSSTGVYNTESTSSNITRGYEAGGTGLSGKSYQDFLKIDSIRCYDEEKTTTIYLRLVACKDEREDPVELKPFVKSNPIPPPV